MKIINQMNSTVEEIIGKQPFDKGKRYVLSQYIYKVRIDEGILLYNSLTKAIVELTYDDSISPCEELVSTWFYFEPDVDQYEFCLKLKTEYQKKTQITEERADYTIFTTMACNARCAYCFENDMNRQLNMSHETALNVAKYVSNTKDKFIKLWWFGGEPTVNSGAIDTICSYIKDNTNKDYSSRLVSNAYLLDSIGIDKLIDLWHLTFIQCTIDGLYEDYDNVKNFVYKNDKHPFVKVMNNLRMLVDYDVDVNIRLNITADNYEQLRDVVVYLNDHFPPKSLSIYGYPVYPTEENKNDIDYWNKVYDNWLNLEMLVNNSKANNFKNIREWDSLRTHNCMADNGLKASCITPLGNLTLCEHHVDDDIVGNIYSDKVNQNVIDEYHKYNPDIEECKTCPYKPMCISLTKCPNNFVCTDHLRKYKDYTVRTGLLNWYLNATNNGKDDLITQCNRDVIPDKSVVMLE